jgi:hypothetical protein
MRRAWDRFFALPRWAVLLIGLLLVLVVASAPSLWSKGSTLLPCPTSCGEWVHP